MPSPRKRLLILLALTCAAGTGIGILVVGELDDGAQETLSALRERGASAADLYRRDLAKMRPAFVEAQRELAAYEVFTPSRGTDASPWLNRIVPWTASSSSAAAAIAAYRRSLGPNAPAELAIPPELSERLKICKDACWSEARALPLQDLNFGWMREALSAGRWNVLENSPLQHWKLGVEDAAAGYTIPAPQGLLLLDLARLRLLRGLAEGELGPAVREVRHLARLLLSTHELLLSVTGVRVLIAETELHRYAVEQGLPMPAEWTPIPAEVLEHAKLVFLTYPISPWLSVAKLEELRAEGSIGFCAALTDAASSAVFARPLLHDRDAAYFAWMERELAADGACRLGALLPYWRIWDGGFPPEYYHSLLEVDGSPVGDATIKAALRRADLEHDPEGRHALGDVFLAIATRTLRTEAWVPEAR